MQIAERRVYPMWSIFFLAMTGFGGEERQPHPLAPSIPLLTREEYRRIDDIIDRFIEFDVGGKIKGSEGKKVLRDLEALGPEAIFPLIAGFNRGADMESSCPCVIIGRKIARILNASNDVHLLTFAKENLGVGVGAKRHMAVVEDLKLAAQLRRTQVVRRLGPPPPFPSTRSPLRKLSIGDLAERIEGKQGKQAIDELGRRADPGVLDILADASQGPVNAAAAQAALQTWIAKLPLQEVRKLLRHPQGTVRRAAAAQAGQQPSLAGELIELLADNDADVAQAARASLTRISGGLDFGPSPSATIEERSQSIAQWRQWRRK